jgi:ATP-dependent protease ClpP protease subunit
VSKKWPPPSPPTTSAEAAKFEAEAELAKASARKTIAEAKSAEAHARIAELKALDAEQAAEEDEASDDNRHVYRFNAAVSPASTTACIAHLNLWHRLDPDCDIEIIFNSPGGTVIDGMALFDQIAAFSKRGGGTHKVTVGCRGYAASMAGILLQSGDVRWIGRRSYLMIHEISAGTGGKIGEIKDDVKFYDAICEQVIDIFLDRANGKIKRDEFKKRWERQDWWILAEDCKKFGFVDEVR